MHDSRRLTFRCRSCGATRLTKTAVFPYDFFFMYIINQQGLDSEQIVISRQKKNKLSYVHFFAMTFSEHINMTSNLSTLAYQPAVPHKLIRINIKINLIANNYNYLSHTLFHLLKILTRTLKYIFIIILLQ